ncbi:hypothetical protein HNR23_000617 [Nocardiopsis mwathae]|uniref:DUF1850 domain-containing protein n=1 Tax=Nocardiopsis mwathae TaxID=1472723 RepID=A0A7W9YEC6_9ACTN|nr:DUF1850 domain-containing protein [Nocardiopsis mwathae]MBB6170557.1 hypothetical protein [Nocardiopsis mwathae]
MRRRRPGRGIGAAAGAALLAVLLWPAWPVLELDGPSGPIGDLPLDGYGRFGLTFVHSVDGLPIEDRYQVRDGRIVQESTLLMQFGAGTGHIPGNGTGRAVGERWEVSGLDRDIGELRIRVGAPPADHRLHHPGGELTLSGCWAGDAVVVRPARISTVRRLMAAIAPTHCPSPRTEGAQTAHERRAHRGRPREQNGRDRRHRSAGRRGPPPVVGGR